MKAFMDKDFMLQSATAQHLYHDYAAAMPICDYHCHIPPREIYENRRFENITQVWLGGRNPDGSYFGDHYKWRVMRSNGVPEAWHCLLHHWRHKMPLSGWMPVRLKIK